MSESAREWHAKRSFHHSAFEPARKRSATVSICVPARDEIETVGHVVETLVALRERGAIDEIIVVDGASSDGTAELAARLGADVLEEGSLLPEFGPVLGKGDAMWRALSVAAGDIVCFLDADSGGFGPHYATGLAGPLLRDPSIQFVKAYYRRPFAGGDAPDGGRVTELTARPLLNLFYPELAGFRQPLAGEFAARRALLEQLSFSTGYAVEIALLIDAWKAAGLDALAQVDLDVRHNRHQPLADLSPMAYAVLRAVCDRLSREGRLDVPPQTPLQQPVAAGLVERRVDVVERPPIASLRTRA